MTDNQQFVAAVSVTLVPAFAVLVGTLLNYARLNELNTGITEFRADMRDRFDHMEKLFDAKLSRVEEVIGARLKHLEER